MRSWRWAILTLAAVAVTAGALWLTSLPVSAKEASREDVLADAKEGGYRLITTEEPGMRVSSAPAAAAGPGAEPETPGPLYGWAMLWTLLGIFTGGLALNLTPCVYPLIPITVSYFGSKTTAGSKGRGEIAVHGLCYVAGLAVTNSSLGVIAALTGGLMGGLLQTPLVLWGVAAVLIVFATSLFGFWEIRLPAGLTQAAAKSYSGYLGSLFMGLTLGVVAAPCIGPFVLGLVTWVAGIGSPWLGFIVFFTLSLGLGFPLFFLAVFSGQLDRLPRSGDWMIWVRKLMGWVLIGMAAHFLSPVLPEFAGTLLPASVAVAAAVHLGWIDKTLDDSRSFIRIKAVTGLICLVFATLLVASWTMLGTQVDWKPYSDEYLQEARKLRKPVIIDFYASWCMPCRELDRFTFRDPSVVKRAQSGFVMLKVDLTVSGSSLHQRLAQQYGVRGVPTVVFLDADGRERKDLRVVGFMPPDRFLGFMDRAGKSGG